MYAPQQSQQQSAQPPEQPHWIGGIMIPDGNMQQQQQSNNRVAPSGGHNEDQPYIKRARIEEDASSVEGGNNNSNKNQLTTATAINNVGVVGGVLNRQQQMEGGSVDVQSMVTKLVHSQAADMMQQQKQQQLQQQHLQQQAHVAQVARINAARLRQQQELQKYRNQTQQDHGQDTAVWLAATKKLADDFRRNLQVQLGSPREEWLTYCRKKDSVRDLLRGEVGLNTERARSKANDSIPAALEEDESLHQHEKLLKEGEAAEVTELFLCGRISYTEEDYKKLLQKLACIADMVLGAQIFREQCFRVDTGRLEKFRLLASGADSQREFWLRFAYASISPATSAKAKAISSNTIALLRTFNMAFDEADSLCPVSSRIVREVRISQKRALMLLEMPSGTEGDRYRSMGDRHLGYNLSHSFRFKPGTSDEVCLSVDTFHKDFDNPIPHPGSIIVTASRRLAKGEPAESAIEALLEVSSKVHDFVQLYKI